MWGVGNENRPACAQCGATAPVLTQFGIFDLGDDQIAMFRASGWSSDGATAADFSWRCTVCDATWGVV